MHEVATPKVSVCIPVFNGADYLRAAVDTALAQDFEDMEIVIVDNDSSDGTPALVNEIVARGAGRVRAFRNESNVGLAGNLDRCVGLARGRYVKFLCVDDLLLPGCVGRMAGILDREPGVALVCGARNIIDASGAALAVQRYGSGDRITPGPEVISRCVFEGNLIGEPTAVMFRRPGFPGNFRQDLPQLLDMDMWFRLLEGGALASIGDPVCAIRVHGGQLTHANIRSGQLVTNNMALVDEYTAKPYLRATARRWLHYRLLMTYRMWLCRHVIGADVARQAWGRHAIHELQPLMPLVARVLSMRASVRARRS